MGGKRTLGGVKTAVAADKYIGRKLYVDHPRSPIFRDQCRISDHPLAFGAVHRLDHRPGERECAGEQGLLTEWVFWVAKGV